MNKPEIIQQALSDLRSGQGDAAVQRLTPLAHANPGDAELAHLLGLAILSSRPASAALDTLKRAAELAPHVPDFAANYAAALNRAGRHADAVAQYQRVLSGHPDHFSAQLGLSGALGGLHEYDGAVKAAERALTLQPRRPEPWVNIAIAHTRAGRPAEAVERLEQALRLLGDHPLLLTHLVVNLPYLPDMDPAGLRERHERLAAVISRTPIQPPPVFPNTPDPERPLRVGYMSPDFRTHSIMHFFLPLLAAHDPSHVQAYCYSAVQTADEVTAEAKALCHRWRDIAWTSDRGIEDRVRGDQIDILVDLAGHSAASRLHAMARRMAPIQVSYLGYAATTGMPTIDYRIVDAITDPPGSEPHSTETLCRLPGCFLCYRPPPDAPEVAPQPWASGSVTFGSFNAAFKLNEPVFRAWSELLRAVPGSRLLLKMHALDSSGVRADLTSRLQNAGIDPAQVELLGWQASRASHLETYHRVDIGLDTFPYNGTTTTCEALWMGVPVVTLRGRFHAGRVGASLLSAVGLPELVAESREQYVTLAADLARDLPRLSAMRSTLRARVRDSALCNRDAFGRKLDAAYRDMWRTFCTRTG